MSVPEVVLVRHAETAWSLARRHTGRSDVPLTDSGRTAAIELGGRLDGWSFARVFTSPARRARETCELCGLGDRAEVREELWEWDYGAYEGLTMAEIQELAPGWSLWRDGCPAGESPADVGARADRAIAEVAELDGAVAVFSHGHFLRVLGARWISLQPALGARLALATAALGVLSHERVTRVIGRWNDAG
jgi:probable phosphoglycerate mutase